MEKDIEKYKDLHLKMSETTNDIFKIINGEMTITKFIRKYKITYQWLYTDDYHYQKFLSQIGLSKGDLEMFLKESMSPYDYFIKDCLLLKKLKRFIYFDTYQKEEKIDQLLRSELTEEDYQLVSDKYGFQSEIPMTYSELGKKHNVHASTIIAKIHRILRNIRKPIIIEYMKNCSVPSNVSIPDYSTYEETLKQMNDKIKNLTDQTKELEEQLNIARKQGYELNISIPLSTPIANLELSSREIRQLQRNGYTTIGSLYNITESKLLNIRNLGKKSVDHIIEVLKKYNIPINK